MNKFIKVRGGYYININKITEIEPDDDECIITLSSGSRYKICGKKYEKFMKCIELNKIE